MVSVPADYPCPTWCQVSESRPGHRGEVDWSDCDTHASRPHATAAIQHSESPLSRAQGSQGVTVDIGADEVVPVLADGSRGPSLLEERLIRLYAWVQMDGCVADEVTYDMTADQARELASSLSRAAEQLDAINNGDT